MTKIQRDWLIKNNLDPEIYDVDAEGNVSESPIMGKGEAALRSAAVSVAPSLTALPASVTRFQPGVAVTPPAIPASAVQIPAAFGQGVGHPLSRLASDRHKEPEAAGAVAPRGV